MENNSLRNMSKKEVSVILNSQLKLKNPKLEVISDAFSKDNKYNFRNMKNGYYLKLKLPEVGCQLVVRYSLNGEKKFTEKQYEGISEKVEFHIEDHQESSNSSHERNIQNNMMIISENQNDSGGISACGVIAWLLGLRVLELDDPKNFSPELFASCIRDGSSKHSSSGHTSLDEALLISKEEDSVVHLSNTEVSTIPSGFHEPLQSLKTKGEQQENGAAAIFTKTPETVLVTYTKYGILPSLPHHRFAVFNTHAKPELTNSSSGAHVKVFDRIEDVSARLSETFPLELDLKDFTEYEIMMFTQYEFKIFTSAKRPRDTTQQENNTIELDEEKRFQENSPNAVDDSTGEESIEESHRHRDNAKQSSQGFGCVLYRCSPSRIVPYLVEFACIAASRLSATSGLQFFPSLPFLEQLAVYETIFRHDASGQFNDNQRCVWIQEINLSSYDQNALLDLITTNNEGIFMSLVLKENEASVFLFDTEKQTYFEYSVNNNTSELNKIDNWDTCWNNLCEKLGYVKQVSIVYQKKGCEMGSPRWSKSTAIRHIAAI
eukprot:gb/GECH01006448.1/.p1 GENE.gb/GECH01006448.1/~~gb/GECH01006448.1/.p1  ORF type:complete len:547 (+),score=102.72 gb/GECH01006448.1/:1-1641(+)